VVRNTSENITIYGINLVYRREGARLALTRRYFLTSEPKRKWRRRRFRCAGRSLLETFKVKIFLNLIVYPQTKLSEVEIVHKKKKRVWPAVVLQMTYGIA
jgi:hypothetical protein